MILSIILFAGTMLLSLWAMWRVKSVYKKYSRMTCASGATGAQVAKAILDQSDIHDVEIVSLNEQLGDHYDPSKKRLVLSEANYYGQSPAALGVAAHECGHAIQHKLAYSPLHWRMAAVGVTNIASQVVMILPLVSLSRSIFFHRFWRILALAFAGISRITPRQRSLSPCFTSIARQI